MRILSVTHGPTVPGGVFDEVADAAGHELERWVVPLGGSPRPVTRYDAVMVFGGSMHPDQDEQFDWLEREAEFLRGALANSTPVLGVCLGAQMLARAAGARVAPASEPEVGWFDIELTEEGRSDPVVGVLPARTEAFQWHHYTFEIPNGATELARSDICAQAFRVGERARGIQFHAEVTLEMVETWTNEEPADLPVTPDAFLAATRARIAGWNEHGRALCGAFLQSALS
ncbi:MAG: type 1 glutamine amidotransferase [Actinomycetota bacterium]|nr:type 1 glutamine amidotransferase [Actinomycetota bacterium]